MMQKKLPRTRKKYLFVMWGPYICEGQLKLNRQSSPQSGCAQIEHGYSSWLSQDISANVLAAVWHDNSDMIEARSPGLAI